MGELKALDAIATLGLASHDVQDLVYDLGALGVVALGPVVAGAVLTEDEVVRTVQFPEVGRTNGVDGTRLQVNDHGTRYVTLVHCFVEEDVDLVELGVARALVRTVRLDSMLSGYHLPKLRFENFYLNYVRIYVQF